MKDIPEAAPALDFLPELLEESEIIETSATVNDPTIGRLMAVGGNVQELATMGEDEEELRQRPEGGITQSILYATGPSQREIGMI